MQNNLKDPSVSIVIVTWNNEKDIEDCLSSVLKINYRKILSITVVDNNSSDQTINLIKSKFPSVKLIESKKNLYFTGGNNLGFKVVIKNDNPDFVLTLNPDTYVEADLISKLVKITSRDERIGIVGPKIKFWNNPNDGKINSAGMIFDGFLQGYDRGFEEKDSGQYDFTEEIIAVSGTCMLLRTKMLSEVGMFWERLRMYIEDVELCIRAKKGGWKVFYTGDTTVFHKWMQSTNQSSIVRKNNWMKRNWLLIALRHYSLKSKFAMIKYYFFG